MLYIEATAFYVCELTEYSEVESSQLYAVNATANQFFLAAIAIRYHLTPFRTQK